MVSEWYQVPLGSICEKVLTGGTPLKSRKEYFENPTIPWLKTKEVNFCRIYNTEYYISELGLEESSAKLIPENSVIVAMYGQGDTAGRVAINKVPICTNQACCNLIVDKAKADYEFIYYYLKSSYSELVRRKTGSAQPNLNTKIVKDFEIYLPPLNIQSKIGRILGSLDDKIQLNRQMNETLEALAQNLFQSWFVHFDPVIDNALAAGNPIPEPLHARAEARKALGDKRKPLPEEIQGQFPDSFVFSEEMGWIPEGWEVESLSDVVDEIIDHRGKTPKKLGDVWSKSGFPAISAKNIKKGRIVRHDTIRYVSENLYNKWMKTVLQYGDIALTSEAPLGEMFYFTTKTDYLLSQRLYGLRVDQSILSGCYLYFWLQTIQGKTDLENRATGTTVTGIRQSELRKVKVLCPSIDIVNELSPIIDSLLLKIDCNETNILKIESLRDTLLPRLLSGEVEIPDVEKMVGEVIKEL